ncbi:MAG: iron ABC transporter permease [Myxococcales bacterium]|nr:iron ABC transporter permease [Myxococcales bacterium]
MTREPRARPIDVAPPEDTRRTWRLRSAAFLGIALGTAVLVAGVAIGTSRLPLGDALDGLLGRGDPLIITVVRELRLPRALLGLGVGAALAVAGVLMQAVFRNPLASPDLLGASSGASFGAILAFSFGLATSVPLTVPFFAVGGAMAVLLLVLWFSRETGRLDSAGLLLAGIALTSFISALNSALLATTLPYWDLSRALTTWLLGGLTDRTWQHVGLLAPGLVAGIAVAIACRRALDLMTQGDEVATALGVNVAQVRRLALVAAALLAGSAVAVSGLIGFVGLVVPHALRLVVGPTHGSLLPLAALWGACFLGAMDVGTRLIGRSVELPLGVITALVGAPLFAWLIARSRGRAS